MGSGSRDYMKKWLTDCKQTHQFISVLRVTVNGRFEVQESKYPVSGNLSLGEIWSERSRLA